MSADRAPRLTPSVSPFATKELTEVAALLGIAPSTLAARGIEQWIVSDDFERLKERAIKAMKNPQETIEND